MGTSKPCEKSLVLKETFFPNIHINFTQLFFFILVCPLFVICTSNILIRRGHLRSVFTEQFCGYLHSSFLILHQFAFPSCVGLFFRQLIFKAETYQGRISLTHIKFLFPQPIWLGQGCTKAQQEEHPTDSCDCWESRQRPSLMGPDSTASKPQISLGK